MNKFNGIMKINAQNQDAKMMPNNGYVVENVFARQLNTLETQATFRLENYKFKM